LKNFNRLFWLFNISGWIVLYLVVLLFCYSNYLSDIKIVSGVGITYLTAFLLTLLLRMLYKKFYVKNKSILRSFLYILIISIIASHIWYWIDAVISALVFQNPSFLNLSINSIEADIIVLKVPVLVAWSSLYYIIKLWTDLVVEKERVQKADLLAHKAQLQMLRYQINPHFLFNTLNTIRALVEENKDKAKQVITELSEFLRYSLINKNNTMVAFSDELDAIRHYIAIQKIRYEEKLDVYMEIQPGIEKIQILSFLIYPLVENAIKYGMKTSNMPLEIRLNAKMNNDYLHIDIINTGKWIDNSNKINSIDRGTGQGIDNVKLRLENAYGKHHSFNIKEENYSVIITLQIKISENEKEF
jgi:two-component system, LytTR family, sensor kinase